VGRGDAADGCGNPTHRGGHQWLSQSPRSRATRTAAGAPRPRPRVLRQLRDRRGDVRADVDGRRPAVVHEVIVHGGVAISSDVATAIPIAYNYATGKFAFYEGSAAGTALSEKTNAEAYPTGCKCRVTVIGN
jgi:hypothetical protein